MYIVYFLVSSRVDTKIGGKWGNGKKTTVKSEGKEHPPRSQVSAHCITTSSLSIMGLFYFRDVTVKSDR